MRCRSAAREGASVKPQLPMTTVVTLWRLEQVPRGFQYIYASMWV